MRVKHPTRCSLDPTQRRDATCCLHAVKNSPSRSFWLNKPIWLKTTANTRHIFVIRFQPMYARAMAFLFQCEALYADALRRTLIEESVLL